MFLYSIRKLQLSLTVLTACLFVSGLSVAQTSVWKISKGQNYFYLGGTVHVLRASEYPLPNAYHQAYEASSLLYFEADMGEKNSASFQAKMLEQMTLPEGQTLENHFKSSDYARLEKFLADRNIPIGFLNNLKPWAFTLTVTMMEYARHGLVATHGIDAFFYNLAQQDQKESRFFETLDEQMQLLASTYEEGTDGAVDLFIDQLENLPETIEVLLNTWRNGDLEAMANDPSVQIMKEKNPKDYKKFFTDRNNAWMKTLTQLNEDEIVEFVLVGALHLPDEGGLLQLLQQQGFTIEQL